ncbi:MAG TPA: cellulase family glycosylhydrolase [Chitinophagaceae bacterium]|nr:cellulase family glycosylhydrolase [Chitinophagaceae bacterium]
MKLLLFLLAFSTGMAAAQPPVYIDKQGVLRWTKDKAEAAFFGVNYTVPFAYGYRSHLALGVKPEAAIDADVYHLQRLGLDAFRVHVWDVEISDSAGNLLDNEHLRLFDYLVKKLKEKNIKILITPIAFWGNGYPERDERTPGFSTKYGKGPAVVLEDGIKAQENYLKQFFTHVNPYTKLTYTADPDVIAMEINNEPHHSGPKEKATEYVNRLAAAVRSTGWKKPVFYNISESPAYAGAVVKADVDGHSFQWYPTGLVANHEQKGNFLPNVDQYKIPFGDTIPAFASRAKMVYEFDAGDVMQPIMYPAMARSYRTEGFQWATQFAYDPLYTAYANTEYQTHYLNLVYTPAKAISLLIASKVFHKLPRAQRYGTYPEDTAFDVFTVSYKQQLSLMNDDTMFYYSNNTTVAPKNIRKLKHIAGVGSSPIVQYEGKGAYFLDKISSDTWRLEVMPDAIPLSDPFDHASPRKEVTRIQWASNKITFLNSSFRVEPGVYLISNGSLKAVNAEFYAPKPVMTEPAVVHQPFTEVSPGKAFFIDLEITGTDSTDKVTIEIHNSSNKWRTLQAKRINNYDYRAEVPADIVTPGIINYRVMVKNYTFPGAFKGDPYAWDEYRNESWQTFVAADESPLELFNAVLNRNSIILYNPDWRNNAIEYIATGTPGQLALKATAKQSTMGWQYCFAGKIAGRNNESFTKLVVRARSLNETKLNVSLITASADAYSATLSLSKEWKDYEIPLASLQPGSFLLLPRPYPGFLPLYFRSSANRALNMPDSEKIEFRFNANAQPASVEVQAAWLVR